MNFEQLLGNPLLLGTALGLLAVLGLTLALAGIRRSRQATQVKATKPKSAADNPDRFFTKAQLAEGHKRAGHRCEYTFDRPGHHAHGARCLRKAVEGDHFIPYSKGGATELGNFVSACLWHNQTKRADLWLHEAPVIEKRRAKYYPKGVDRAVGAYRAGGMRLTFGVNDDVFRLDSTDLQELLTDCKEVIAHYYPAEEVAVKLQAVTTVAELIDYIWESKGLYLDNAEGVDPVSGEWMPLREPSAWMKEKTKDEDE